MKILTHVFQSVVDETVKNTVPEPSDGEIRPIANNELNLQGLKVQQNLPSGMTVTIVQEGIDGALKLQIGEKSTETEGDTLVKNKTFYIHPIQIIFVSFSIQVSYSFGLFGAIDVPIILTAIKYCIMQ